MPCQCDYLEPNDRERESVLVAELLVYAYTSLGLGNIAPYENIANQTYGFVETLDEDIALLCQLCKEIEFTGKADKIIYDGRHPTARKLAGWWERHQADDKRREAHIETIRKSAKAKLTAEEKEVLGL